MNLIELIGFVAAISTTGAYIPQTLKVIRTRKTDDLSLGTYILLCVGIIMWLVYGFLVKSVPIILANVVTFALTFAILVLKIKHK